MDPILLKQKVTKWVEACQFLKSADIKEQLDPAEWTAVDELSNLWNKNFEGNSVKDSAQEYISVLKQCENLHPNNLKIKEYSKQLTGVARDMLTKDAATYNEFKAALQSVLRENRPKQTKAPQSPQIPKVPQTPKKQPTPQTPKVPHTTTPRVNDTGEIIVKSVDFGNTYKDCSIINDYGTPIRVGSYYINPRLDIQTLRTATVKIHIVAYDRNNKKRYEYDSTVNLKGSGRYALTGYGNDKGTFFDEVGVMTYKFYCENTLLYTARLNVLPSLFANEPVRITSADFANVTYEGKVINDYGVTLPNTTQYMKPRIQITTSRVGDVKVQVVYKSPLGETMLSDTEIFVNGSGRYVLSGYGNKNGTCYKETGKWQISFKIDGKVVMTAPVTITGNNRTSVPPKTPRIHNVPKTPRINVNDNSHKRENKNWKKWLKWGLMALVVLVGYMVLKNNGCSKSNDDYRYVIADGVKLYADSTTQSNPLLVMNEGEQVKVIEDNGEWTCVKVEDGTRGYLHYSYLINEMEQAGLKTALDSADEAVRKKFDGLRYQVMKRQALVDMIGSSSDAGVKLMDVATTTSGATYGAVAYMLKTPSGVSVAAYSFGDNGYPSPEGSQTYNADKNIVSIRSITYSKANGYLVKIVDTSGKTIVME